MNTDGECKRCGPGKFFDETTKTCINCLNGCQLCLSLSICTKCDAGLILASNLSQCVSSCETKYYTLNGVCKKCP
jgi:proprotein convertase subtilisin/kexin type 5